MEKGAAVVSQSRPSVISLFVGTGGLDLGLEAAGFETRVCVEMDRDSVRTIRHNRPWPIIPRRIETIPSEELLETAGLRRGEVDLVAGGPPCQPFSKSAYWSTGDTKRLADPRASTLGDFMRVVEDCLPRAFLLENVFGLAYEGKDEGLQFLRQRIREINARRKVRYTFFPKVLNAADYGVPQIRERVFIVGCREAGHFIFPEPRFADNDEAPQQGLFPLKRYRTAWDAIGDLNHLDHGDALQMGGRWAQLLPSVPEGQNYLWHSERGGGLRLFRWRSRYWSFLLKLAKNRPSWTIQAQPGSAIGPFHWKNRRLSGREMCRLQTFPDDFEVVGGITSVQRQLGNAVPAALAELLGLEIRRQILKHAVTSESLSRVPPERVAPPPEPLKPVPSVYREPQARPVTST
jgi:DNA (cytosine-5)-methyltransferase 1